MSNDSSAQHRTSKTPNRFQGNPGTLLLPIYYRTLITHWALPSLSRCHGTVYSVDRVVPHQSPKSMREPAQMLPGDAASRQNTSSGVYSPHFEHSGRSSRTLPHRESQPVHPLFNWLLHSDDVRSFYLYGISRPSPFQLIASGTWDFHLSAHRSAQARRSTI